MYRMMLWSNLRSRAKGRKRGRLASFYLSVSEWRSFREATGAGHNYSIWLFQYKALDDFENARHKIRLIVFEEIKEEWLSPNGYFVLPEEGVGTCYSITE